MSINEENDSIRKGSKLLLDTGMKLEVNKKLNEMYEDGTLKSIINEIISENQI